MANKTKIKDRKVTKTTQGTSKLIVQELNITSADRQMKDIGEFKQSLVSAESVYYPNRSRLYDFYKFIDLDPHISGLIQKRVDSILNKKLAFKTMSGKKVDQMDKVINSNSFREMIRQMILSLMWGISGLEFIPGPELKFINIPRKHIKPEKKVIAIEQNNDDGIPYEGISNLWIIGNENDLGLLLKCSMYAIWKMGAMSDYAQYIEIFGQPVRVVYYDAYDTKTRMELRKVLDESGSSLAMMIPKQAQFEMKDGKQSNGTGELQNSFVRYCDEESSIIILGNTETTTSSKSSGYAQSKEHGKQQLEITKSDMVFVTNLLNSEKCLSILRSYGLPVDGGEFVFEKETDLAELLNKAKIEEIVMRTYNIPIDDDYVYETYGISKPDNYDELKKQQEEERKLKMFPPNQPPQPTNNDNPPPKPKEEKKKQKSSGKKLSDSGFWMKLRSNLADFFDPAP